MLLPIISMPAVSAVPKRISLIKPFHPCLIPVLLALLPYLSTGDKQQQWVFLADQSLSMAEDGRAELLAVKLFAASEGLDFLEPSVKPEGQPVAKAATATGNGAAPGIGEEGATAKGAAVGKGRGRRVLHALGSARRGLQYHVVQMKNLVLESRDGVNSLWVAGGNDVAEVKVLSGVQVKSSAPELSPCLDSPLLSRLQERVRYLVEGC